MDLHFRIESFAKKLLRNAQPHSAQPAYSTQPDNPAPAQAAEVESCSSRPAICVKQKCRYLLDYWPTGECNRATTQKRPARSEKPCHRSASIRRRCRTKPAAGRIRRYRIPVPAAPSPRPPPPRCRRCCRPKLVPDHMDSVSTECGIFRRRSHGEFVAVGLADNDGPGLLQPFNHRRIVGRNVVLENF